MIIFNERDGLHLSNGKLLLIRVFNEEYSKNILHRVFGKSF